MEPVDPTLMRSIFCSAMGSAWPWIAASGPSARAMAGAGTEEEEEEEEEEERSAEA
jgi:ribosomal protein L12E/L44/L45/RPP1/RPP2